MPVRNREVDGVLNNCINAGTRSNYRQELKFFLEFYALNEKHYDRQYHGTWTKGGNTFLGWTLDAERWSKWMECSEGNILFDYIIHRRKTHFYPKGHIGTSHFSKVRSAIAHLMNKVLFKSYSEKAKMMLDKFYTGLGKQSARWKAENGKGEEKDAFPFAVYVSLAQAILRRSGVQYWCFFLLQWNLMARSTNVKNVQMQHLGWDGDMLTILFSHTKTNPTRKDLSKIHLAANPDNAAVCPVLAVACLLLQGYHDDKELFEGGSQDKGYNKAIREALKDPSVLAVINACAAEMDIASHSLRKSAATHAAGGTTCAPGAFTVLLRGGWSIGSVMKRYIKQATAGDRYMGYLLSGRDPLAKEWLKLPPYFKAELSDETIKGAFCGPYVDAHYEQWKGMLGFFIASAVHHCEFIEDMLPSDSALLHNMIFTSRERLVELQSLLPMGDEWYTDNRKLLFTTARTPWSVLFSKMEDIQKQIEGRYGESTHARSLIDTQKLKEMLHDTVETLVMKSKGNTADSTTANLFVHGIGKRELLVPKNFLEKKNPKDSNFKSVFRVFWLGNTEKKISPLRYVLTKQTTAHGNPTKARKFKNMKRACDLLSAHIAFNHESLWQQFCDNPNDFNLNKAFEAGWESVRQHVKKPKQKSTAVSSLNPAKPIRTRKRKWNTMSANTFESQTREYNRTLRKEQGISPCDIWIEMGKFPVPKKSLTVRVRSALQSKAK